jgi:Flp pilus assembly protein CpaB
MAKVRRTSSFVWRHATALRASAAGLLVLTAVGSCAGAEPQVELREVVVASRDIPSGSRLAPEDLAVAEDSLGLLTPSAQDLAGETARGPISAGEPITASRLTPGRSVSAAPGTVVFPLTLPDERIAGLLMAGDRVDVIVTPDSLHGGEAASAAEDVEVLTVTAPPDDGPGSALSQAGSVVLLAVTPEQAAALAGIRRSDRVSVAIG